jgi:hypothetical protein
MLDPAIGYLIVAGIALLFASAAVHKLRDLARFAAVFAAYHVLPDAPARRVAWLIPCLELGIALALCWESSRRAALASAFTVLIAYAAALGVNLLRGRRDLDCGCGAARGRRVIADWMVWRNLLLASALGIAALPWSLRPVGMTDLLTVVGGLMVGATLYAAVDRLLGDVIPKAMTLRSTS